MTRLAIIPFLSLLLTAAAAQSSWNPRYPPLDPALKNPELLTQRWSAGWVSVPGASPFEYGVYHFRRTFTLESTPASFVVHVTADNRYELFVNGQRIAWGPARGDLAHWRYESLDLAPHLRAGKNVLAAVVWNYGQYAPEAQVTNQTGFLLQGNTEKERVVDTNKQWKCLQNLAYRPLHFTHAQMRGYFVVGPGDRVDGSVYPWGWESTDFDDSGWPAAVADSRGAGSPWGTRDAGNRWMLVPRSIPMMEERPERLAATRFSAGIEVPEGFPAQIRRLDIPANSEIRVILDQSHLTTAFPELVVSGGKGAHIWIGYAESLFERGGRRGDKGNRNEVEGKEFIGFYDEFISAGRSLQLFRPLWWRTYRYVELKVRTHSEPLTIEDLRGMHVSYPFEMKARLETGSERIDQLLEVGWRTARLCAHETYMDCPYYEQLQYAGDTRIQGLVSLYNSGDSRLLRNAIAQLDDSRSPEGLTLSRAPTRQEQYIPPFSLWWIGMLHDYWMYTEDPEFVRQTLPGVRTVLSFFRSYQKPDGSLRRMPFWNFVDWASAWPNGVPPAEENGSSALLDLQLFLAYGWAGEMESALGSKEGAGEYAGRAAQLGQTIKKLYWNPDRRMFSDTSSGQHWSQLTNALAVLGGLVAGEDARSLIKRVLVDQTIVPCTYYSKHYLNSAVNLVGEGDRYLDLLGEWDEMLASGLTTWAERPVGASNPPRSDCHAWSAHPNFEIFRTLLGIDSSAPGFAKVEVRPFLGKLNRVSGSIPHPKGQISVTLERTGSKLVADVGLPAGVTGAFVWKGARKPLSDGMNRLVFSEP